MEKFSAFVAALSLVLGVVLLHGGGRTKVTALMQTERDGLEEWGYVQVRPKAHMFWWLYRSPNRVENASKPWPIILWLQGGPGASGVGIGNFAEIGPLDFSLNPRRFTWLTKADLLFVDSPVGAGYSYVEDLTVYVKTDAEATSDLTTLLIEIFNRNETLQNPLYIVGESYGGKFAVSLALSALKAIQQGKLKLKLGGVVLGDSWISPEDYVFSWGPLLKDLSRFDDNGLQIANRNAEKIKGQLESGQFVEATKSWGELESIILNKSNYVDFYNFMVDSNSGLSTLSAIEQNSNNLTTMGSSHFASFYLEDLLNGVIKKKLKIIPWNVTWAGMSSDAFMNLQGDFMKPRIAEVDELLANGVNVTVYNGQVDLMCATKGTEAWIKKLKWAGLPNFLRKDRRTLFCGRDDLITKGFVKSYKNLNFYWILGAGHFVPIDQPCAALEMVGEITQSTAA